eukprot:TRINITY_DN687_c3_g1_i1.p1 TRINITY_DN687_c3_g1~~TRINITY_DN687_c3_g1_i1.p1  ORF type:complete len:1272 (-),score=374.34 TRINITY_DN687_c3_g1_i1:34-3660(-)
MVRIPAPHGTRASGRFPKLPRIVFPTDRLVAMRLSRKPELKKLPWSLIPGDSRYMQHPSVAFANRQWEYIKQGYNEDKAYELADQDEKRNQMERQIEEEIAAQHAKAMGVASLSLPDKLRRYNESYAKVALVRAQFAVGARRDRFERFMKTKELNGDTDMVSKEKIEELMPDPGELHQFYLQYPEYRKYLRMPMFSPALGPWFFSSPGFSPELLGAEEAGGYSNNQEEDPADGLEDDADATIDNLLEQSESPHLRDREKLKDFIEVDMGGVEVEDIEIKSDGELVMPEDASDSDADANIATSSDDAEGTVEGQAQGEGEGDDLVSGLHLSSSSSGSDEEDDVDLPAGLGLQKVDNENVRLTKEQKALMMKYVDYVYAPLIGDGRPSKDAIMAKELLDKMVEEAENEDEDEEGFATGESDEDDIVSSSSPSSSSATKSTSATLRAALRTAAGSNVTADDDEDVEIVKGEEEEEIVEVLGEVGQDDPSYATFGLTTAEEAANKAAEEEAVIQAIKADRKGGKGLKHGPGATAAADATIKGALAGWTPNTIVVPVVGGEMDRLLESDVEIEDSEAGMMGEDDDMDYNEPYVVEDVVEAVEEKKKIDNKKETASSSPSSSVAEEEENKEVENEEEDDSLDNIAVPDNVDIIKFINASGNEVEQDHYKGEPWFSEDEDADSGEELSSSDGEGHEMEQLDGDDISLASRRDFELLDLVTSDSESEIDGDGAEGSDLDASAGERGDVNADVNAGQSGDDQEALMAEELEDEEYSGSEDELGSDEETDMEGQELENMQDVDLYMKQTYGSDAEEAWDLIHDRVISGEYMPAAEQDEIFDAWDQQATELLRLRAEIAEGKSVPSLVKPLEAMADPPILDESDTDEELVYRHQYTPEDEEFIAARLPLGYEEEKKEAGSDEKQQNMRRRPSEEDDEADLVHMEPMYRSFEELPLVKETVDHPSNRNIGSLIRIAQKELNERFRDFEVEDMAPDDPAWMHALYEGDYKKEILEVLDNGWEDIEREVSLTSINASARQDLPLDGPMSQPGQLPDMLGIRRSIVASLSQHPGMNEAQVKEFIESETARLSGLSRVDAKQLAHLFNIQEWTAAENAHYMRTNKEFAQFRAAEIEHKEGNFLHVHPTTMLNSLQHKKDAALEFNRRAAGKLVAVPRHPDDLPYKGLFKSLKEKNQRRVQQQQQQQQAGGSPSSSAGPSQEARR